MDATAPPLRKPPVTGPFRPSLSLAVGVAACWVAAISMLTLLTANPVTLNRAQILESRWIATGQVSGKNSVRKTETGDWPFADQAEIQIVNLPETGAKSGETYLFPLQPFVRQGELVDGVYVVTPSHLPNFAPLIYPFHSETQRQLQQILPNAGR